MVKTDAFRNHGALLDSCSRKIIVCNLAELIGSYVKTSEEEKILWEMIPIYIRWLLWTKLIFSESYKYKLIFRSLLVTRYRMNSL